VASHTASRGATHLSGQGSAPNRIMLKSVVQGNYYAVPGNLASLGMFRDRVLALWWRTIRRRSQKRRVF